MKPHETMPLNVVLERRKIDHPWQDYAWKVVAVFVGGPELDPRGEWRLLRRDERCEHYHAGTLPLELFRSETEGYRLSLSQRPPRLFVIVRRCEEGPHDMYPFRVTACPYEAEGFLDGGDDLVEAVVMPEAIFALVRDFVEVHHVEQEFEKRRRKRRDPEKNGFRSPLGGASVGRAGIPDGKTRGPGHGR